MRWLAAFALPCLGIMGLMTAMAAEPSQPAAQGQQAPAPAASSRQLPVVAPHPITAATVPNRSGDGNRGVHLWKAAEHLQAAGLKSLADHVRELSSTPGASQSPPSAGLGETPTQILLHIQLLELDTEKIRRLGFEFTQWQSREGAPEKKPVQFFTGNFLSVNLGPDPERFVEALREDGLARVLAEPTLVALDGRPAHFHVGGHVMVWDVGPSGTPVSRPEPYGTQIDLLPRLDGKGGLRLELRCECSELDRTKSVMVAGKENPGFRTTEIVTNLKMKLGETFVLGGLSREANDKATGTRAMTTTVMLVMAETIDPVAAAQSPHHPQRR